MASKSRLTQEISDQFLICKICLETYKQPKTLNCLHTFCMDCIGKHAESEFERQRWSSCRTFPCPVCRKKNDLPTGGVRRLPDNFLVSNLTEVINRQKPSKIPMCEICQSGIDAHEREAICKCLDCSKLLCVTCTQTHKSTKVTQTHNLFDIDADKDIECQQHKEEQVQFYCEPCQVCICVACTFQDHRGHEVSSFKDGIQKHKAGLESLTDLCHNRIRLIRNQLDTIEACEMNIHKTEQRIKASSNAMISSVRSRERQLMESIHSQYNAETWEFIEKREMLQDTLLSLQSTCNLTDIILKNENIEMLLLKNDITEKLSVLLENQVNTAPPGLSKRIQLVAGKLDVGYLRSGNEDDEEEDYELIKSNCENRETQTAGLTRHSETTMGQNVTLTIENQATQTPMKTYHDQGTKPNRMSVINRSVGTDKVLVRNQAVMVTQEGPVMRNKKLQTDAGMFDPGNLPDPYMSPMVSPMASPMPSPQVRRRRMPSVETQLPRMMFNRMVCKETSTEEPLAKVDKTTETMSAEYRSTAVGDDPVTTVDASCGLSICTSDKGTSAGSVTRTQGMNTIKMNSFDVTTMTEATKSTDFSMMTLPLNTDDKSTSTFTPVRESTTSTVVLQTAEIGTQTENNAGKPIGTSTHGLIKRHNKRTGTLERRVETVEVGIATTKSERRSICTMTDIYCAGDGMIDSEPQQRKTLCQLCKADISITSQTQAANELLKHVDPESLVSQRTENSVSSTEETETGKQTIDTIRDRTLTRSLNGRATSVGTNTHVIKYADSCCGYSYPIVIEVGSETESRCFIDVSSQTNDEMVRCPILISTGTDPAHISSVDESTLTFVTMHNASTGTVPTNVQEAMTSTESVFTTNTASDPILMKLPRMEDRSCNTSIKTYGDVACSPIRGLGLQDVTTETVTAELVDASVITDRVDNITKSTNTRPLVKKSIGLTAAAATSETGTYAETTMVINAYTTTGKYVTNRDVSTHTTFDEPITINAYTSTGHSVIFRDASMAAIPNHVDQGTVTIPSSLQNNSTNTCRVTHANVSTETSLTMRDSGTSPELYIPSVVVPAKIALYEKRRPSLKRNVGVGTINVQTVNKAVGTDYKRETLFPRIGIKSRKAEKATMVGTMSTKIPITNKATMTPNFVRLDRRDLYCLMKVDKGTMTNQTLLEDKDIQTSSEEDAYNSSSLNTSISSTSSAIPSQGETILDQMGHYPIRGDILNHRNTRDMGINTDVGVNDMPNEQFIKVKMHDKCTGTDSVLVPINGKMQSCISKLRSVTQKLQGQPRSPTTPPATLARKRQFDIEQLLASPPASPLAKDNYSTGHYSQSSNSSADSNDQVEFCKNVSEANGAESGYKEKQNKPSTLKQRDSFSRLQRLTRLLQPKQSKANTSTEEQPQARQSETDSDSSAKSTKLKSLPSGVLSNELVSKSSDNTIPKEIKQKRMKFPKMPSFSKKKQRPEGLSVVTSKPPISPTRHTVIQSGMHVIDEAGRPHLVTKLSNLPVSSAKAQRRIPFRKKQMSRPEDLLLPVGGSYSLPSCSNVETETYDNVRTEPIGVDTDIPPPIPPRPPVSKLMQISSLFSKWETV